jgi:hypothetical protein
VSVEDDLVLDAGSWLQTLDEDQRSVTRVIPPSRPMFRQVVDHLEAQPLPASGFVRLADEARATVAVCLRWGSYFALLADSSRPFSPDAWDENTSQIADDEMARMNIEISAAIQWWLTLKFSDEQRYRQLVQRALTCLPLGRKTVTRSPEGNVLAECASAAVATAVQRAWSVERLERDLRLAGTNGVRVIANTMTLLSWRNGPVEKIHAGRRFGHRFNERRVLPRDEKAIIRQAQNVLCVALQAVEQMTLDGAWPPSAQRVLPFMRPFCHPRDWSYSEQSRVVELPLRTN